MKKMIFISRHAPTEAQVAMAAEKGYTLLHVGDVNAFDEEAVMGLIKTHAGYGDAVCCVHPAIAMTALSQWGGTVAVFENGNRAPEGEKPSFEAVKLHLYVQLITVDYKGDVDLELKRS